jgi:hypothetical protein
LRIPRFYHGGDEGKQIAKGEKVTGEVPGVENAGLNGCESLAFVRSCLLARVRSFTTKDAKVHEGNLNNGPAAKAATHARFSGCDG